MKTIIYDKEGNFVTNPENMSCVLFEGNDTVESQIFKKYDNNIELPEIQTKKFDYDAFNCVNGENNVSVFINPKDKIFNVITRSDMENGNYIGTTMSFVGDEYDKFIELMKIIIK